ncbi:MAG: NAD(P)(+) transhydrogenase (Re/Si-specific) subunit alpha, partial [Actinobacteria bacterium]|nr:NAD(P)(+) transhydrogenase (Re/Si-specific) subunit alpha [Actinomycetota bacterium]
MRIAVPKEIKAGEKRVALVPDIISKLTKSGHQVVIESGAGVAAQYSDKQFIDAGAEVKSAEVLSNS